MRNHTAVINCRRVKLGEGVVVAVAQYFAGRRRDNPEEAFIVWCATRVGGGGLNVCAMW